MRFTGIAAAAVLAGCAFAHGNHNGGSQKPVVDDNASWMQKHMAGMLNRPCPSRFTRWAIR